MKMTPRLIVIGGLAVVLTVVAFVVFLPYAVFQPEPTLNANPLTPLEQQGRDLYVSNGCMYCHSQFTRPHDVTPSRPSQAGDFYYDKPHQLGTLRTGPDLANIGLKRGEKWEIDHLKYPRNFTPNSIMPEFSFLSDGQLKAIVAYLDTLGNDQTASTDLMIPLEYGSAKQRFDLTTETFNEGRRVYAQKCLTCHGCAGKGDGPYAMINNARPANLRDTKYRDQPDRYFFWRVSDGVPGTVMPQWENSISTRDRWLAILFVRTAFMDMVPHFADEGDLPPEFDKADPIAKSVETLNAGKSIYIANCAFCHGYAGTGDGPDAKGLMPEPPNFAEGKDFYKTFKPGDWYWRVSESLPLRAMPQWHTWFDEEQLWLVADYVRDVLVFPDPTAEPADPDMPAKAKTLKMPETANVMRGREVYLKRCWMCHGDAGQGEGPSGTNLVPPPVDFTDPALKEELSDADWYWRVSRGVGNSAMPPWHLLLAEEDRWNAIKYVKATFLEPSEPQDVSDETPVGYQALDPAPYSPTGETLALGKERFETLCAGCHGPTAQGDGRFGPKLKPTPADLTKEPAAESDESWWYWRVDNGVVGDANTHPTAMPSWRLILDENEKWAVVFYARRLAGLDGGLPADMAPKGAVPVKPVKAGGQ